MSDYIQGMTITNSNCGRECFIIGGPWISEDPDCPVHGRDAPKPVSQDDECLNLWTELSRITADRERDRLARCALP